MLRLSIAVLAGALVVCCLPALPPQATVLPVLVLSLSGLLFRVSRYPALALLGACVFSHAAHARLDDRLSPGEAGSKLLVAVQVVDFPIQKQGFLQLLVTPVNDGSLPARIRLSWFAAPPGIAIGDTWRLRLKLRRPRGYSNPGGFDYEGWLFRQGIGATGYVVAGNDNSRMAAARPGPVLRLRIRMLSRIDSLFAAGDARAVLKAISVGERSEITRDQWDIYARTGTSHLVAISGLHIGLAAGGAFVTACIFGALVFRRRNIRDVAAVIAVLSALVYALLSGFAVPAQRAFLMALIAAIAYLLRQSTDVGGIVGTAALVVFAIDPLVLLMPGFLLSFLAVVILIWLAKLAPPPSVSETGRLRRRVYFAGQQLMRLQLALMFGLFPLTIVLFGRASLVAPLVNFAILPVFTFATVPAALAGLVLDGAASPAGDALLRLSYRSIEFVLVCLRAVSALPMSTVEPPLSGWSVLFVAGPATLWALSPAGWPGRHVALLAMAATLLYSPPSPPQSCVDVDILDVGQGLSIVVRTAGHTLVYDTGPAYRSGSTAADMAVIPYLQNAGVRQIDALVVSHSDLDHAGGLVAILDRYPVFRRLSGEPDRTGGERCNSSQAWMWDGIRFQILHPPPGDGWLGNDSSCVLLISAGRRKLLITGDIEAAAEARILGAGRLAPVDVVLVPHHGSRTSSRTAFIGKLRPQFAVVAAGHANRWGFPKPDVVARWEAIGAEVLTTAAAGGIATRLCVDRPLQPPQGHRRHAQRFWHD